MATNYLFGVAVPVPAPSGVWPYDPDFGFSKSRKWMTQRHRISPVLEQRFALNTQPLLKFSIGFDTMRGDFEIAGTKFNDIWNFWMSNKGRAIPFYFYDPIPWGTADYNYNAGGGVYYNFREDPKSRVHSPGTGINPAPATGRYLVTADDDNLSFEQFAVKLHKARLTLSGVPG
jgi:hypothetical protein